MSPRVWIDGSLGSIVAKAIVAGLALLALEATLAAIVGVLVDVH